MFTRRFAGSWSDSNRARKEPPGGRTHTHRRQDARVRRPPRVGVFARGLPPLVSVGDADLACDPRPLDVKPSARNPQDLRVTHH